MNGVARRRKPIRQIRLLGAVSSGEPKWVCPGRQPVVAGFRQSARRKPGHWMAVSLHNMRVVI